MRRGLPEYFQGVPSSQTGWVNEIYCGFLSYSLRLGGSSETSQGCAFGVCFQMGTSVRAATWAVKAKYPQT